MSLAAGGVIRFQFFINQTDLLAGTAQEFIAPEDGVIGDLSSVVQAAVTTGGTLSIKRTVTTALDTTVAGVTQTIANAATKGTVQSSSSTVGDDTRKVKKGDRVALVPAGFATAGQMVGFFTFKSLDI